MEGRVACDEVWVPSCHSVMMKTSTKVTYMPYLSRWLSLANGKEICSNYGTNLAVRHEEKFAGLPNIAPNSFMKGKALEALPSAAVGAGDRCSVLFHWSSISSVQDTLRRSPSLASASARTSGSRLM